MTGTATQLRESLIEMNRLLHELDRDESACCGATLSQCSVMQELWARGAPQSRTVQQMSEVLGLAPSTITRTIDPLWKRGWVERTRNADDRRQVWLSLTSTGETIAAQQDARAQTMYHAILAQIPKKERSTAVHTLHQILAAWRQAQATICSSDVPAHLPSSPKEKVPLL